MVQDYRAYKIMQKRNLHTVSIKDIRICTRFLYGSTTQLLLSLFPIIGNMRLICILSKFHKGIIGEVTLFFVHISDNLFS